MQNKKYKYLIGVDEAGRGPLCGPVVAACCMFKIFDLDLFSKVNDSKVLSEKKRVELVPLIQDKCFYAYGSVSAAEVDELNIFWATQEAFKRALDRLFSYTGINPDDAFVIIDGNSFKHDKFNHKAIVKADMKVPLVSAASILAKVKRDSWMERYDKLFPQYKLSQHKGYPTKLHRQAIKEHGPTPIHRKSFKLLPEENAQLDLFQQ